MNRAAQQKANEKKYQQQIEKDEVETHKLVNKEAAKKAAIEEVNTVAS